MAADVPRTFAFRPRFRGLALGSMGLGAAMLGLGVLGGFVAVPLVSGLVGVGIGAAYLRLPTWKLTVTVDDTGLRVGTPGRERFFLAWRDVVRVIASPTTHTCFVDGGAAARSLMVPGVGAPASYDITDRPALVELILARVEPARVQIVDLLENAEPPAPPDAPVPPDAPDAPAPPP